jgi:gamma-glutamylcyclotransferase (GGCT)/AIG2-like uncharacterized protein YtfP
MKNKSHLVFVYGSLMSDQSAYMVWPNRAPRIVPAIIQAKLFDLGPYPAAVMGTGFVLGELHYVDEVDWPQTIGRLDEFEEFYPNDQASSLYSRNLVRARTEEKSERAWAYFLSRGEMVSKLGKQFNSVENNQSFLEIPCASWSEYRKQLL